MSTFSRISLVLGAACIFSSLPLGTLLAATGDNLPKQIDQPPLTHWGPSGPRIASEEELTNPILPDGDHFITIHGGVRSTDEVNIVFAPVFEQTWNAEPDAFVTESPVFGADSSAYFIPAFPTENGENVLIKVDPEGAREFSLTRSQLGDVTLAGTDITLSATLGIGGSPIVLNDPSTGKETVFGATYTRAYAMDEDGNLLWNTAILPPSINAAISNQDAEQLAQVLNKAHRIFGINYHPAADAYVIADISGDVMAFDRRTGKQIGGVMMPGSPAKGGDNLGGSLDNSTDITDTQSDAAMNLLLDVANKTFADSGIEMVFDANNAVALQAVLGGGAVIGNQISIDPNSDSLWIASTDVDSADGNIDGWSEFGALYRIDLHRQGNALSFEFVCHASFDGGTTSTPAVSADGQRIYTTDNYGAALAITPDCQQAWSLEVGEAAVASLAVSSEVGAEIYYPTLTSIYKIQENATRTGATVAWKANLDDSFATGNSRKVADTFLTSARSALNHTLHAQAGFVLPSSALSIGASNLDLAVIGQNGIMIHSGYGLNITLNGFTLTLPIALNNALYDRETGAFINGTAALEENIGAMYTAPDGTIIMGSSPIRRAAIRGLVKLPDFYLPEMPPLLEHLADRLVDHLVRPLTGGVTKYGITERFDLLARDATCQAEKRIANTRDYAPHVTDTMGIRADISDTQRLITQASDAVGDAHSRKEIRSRKARRIAKHLDAAHAALSNQALSRATNQLHRACALLR